MVQIESQSGVDNVEKIAATEGLDILLIGELTLRRERLGGAGFADISRFQALLIWPSS